ncbi:DEAD/DEAH box helicase family protein [Bacillus tianshenii]|uniref:DEAD/DEAH box helicase family protein n=1 Tax=Sutcliffiella tianshenii TaxID=1463404 RepID=UPI001CD7CF2F|nr:DEAD/DEAH box helicase family protein [Bacillus tianshenii]MCA1318386.1 DEAD/DEAH box helicase family protein [Bacillus tianshenii]
MRSIQLITAGLGEELQSKIYAGKTVYFVSSFSMKSGVEMIEPSLRAAAERGADIKILTGDYLYITQPDALKGLMSIHPAIEVRLWKSKGVSFHPKAYMIETAEHDHFFVGSSNLSASAMSKGIEWNVLINDEKEVFEEGTEEFMRLFYHEQTVPLNAESLAEYERNYQEFHGKYGSLAKKWTEQEEVQLMLPSEKNEEQEEFIQETPAPYGVIAPRYAQIEALEELEKTYEEGYRKALVVMATGLGKTYLAGFFAKQFKRILFIAHREEILHQAERSFKNVIPNLTTGLYNGVVKKSDSDAIFASIYTLSMNKHIQRFTPEEFDLVVIDEFHHAAANTYQRVLEYFQPKFLLGITATPDRNDNRDIYGICEGNVAFRIDFLQAIGHGWLSPFQYYGVFDETDYSQITWLGSRYDEEELLTLQLKKSYADKIIEAWETYKQKRTLVFCSSIRQAEFLSAQFNDSGYRTIALTSKPIGISRSKVIKMLEKGQLDAIFTVDLFNEGVDIPSVDTLLFVRPTESLTVFTQQVGRGLRLHENKEYCVIIDLIGNYRNADVKMSLFDQDETKKRGHKESVIPTTPASCTLNLETKVVDLLAEMALKKQPRKDALKDAFYALKYELGRRPRYVELHLQGQLGAKAYYDEWKSYHRFLYEIEELSEQENKAFLKYEDWFKEVEKTQMSRSYKMVLLKAMLEKGPSEWYKPVTAVEVAPYFHAYLTSEEYRKLIDFSGKSHQQMWDYDEKKVAILIATMPMSKWGSNDLVTFEEGKFKIHLDIPQELETIVFEFTSEICEYRLKRYFERKAASN